MFARFILWPGCALNTHITGVCYGIENHVPRAIKSGFEDVWKPLSRLRLDDSRPGKSMPDNVKPVGKQTPNHPKVRDRQGILARPIGPRLTMQSACTPKDAAGGGGPYFH